MGGDPSEQSSIDTPAQALTVYPSKGVPNILPDGSLQYTVDGDIQKYVSTSVDGVPLGSGDVTVTSGSTIVTISPAYLAKLPDGVHTLRVQFKDGYAEVSFTTPYTAALATAPVAAVPATGAGPQYSLYLLFCMACILAIVQYAKAKQRS